MMRDGREEEASSDSERPERNVRPRLEPVLSECVWKTFSIPDFPKLALAKGEVEKVYSEPFSFQGALWKLCVFPRGSNNVSPNFVSMFVELFALEDERSNAIPRIPLHFKFFLVNHLDINKEISQQCDFEFTIVGSDRGFSRFANLDEVLDEKSGYLDSEGTVVFRAKLSLADEEAVRIPTFFAPYDSRAETGYVGLKNQGATCYMNSVLQTMYHLPVLRKAVFNIPTESDPSSIVWALQKLFYQLLSSSHSVSTQDLTSSFGWEDADAFLQHDVQEFIRVLYDTLEEKMKNSVVEKALAELYEGSFNVSIRCLNVDFKSTRTEPFQDVSLNVKECKNILESFKQYTAPEKLDGDNQYRAEQFGLQDAEKTVMFGKLPPVLQIQLKRFEYDPQRQTMVKLNDYFEFYDELNLNEFVDSESGDSTDCTYVLHSVLVHSGSYFGGHYYAYIKVDPEKPDEWLKFDDDNVRKVSSEQAIQANFGGTDTDYQLPGRPSPTMGQRTSSAYMLVYVSKSQLQEFFKHKDSDSDIPTDLVERFKQDLEEAAARQRAEEEELRKLQYSIVVQSRLRDSDASLELPIAALCEPLLCFRGETIRDMKQRIAAENDLSPELIEMFCFVRRDNGTMRPSKYLADYERLDMISTRNALFAHFRSELDLGDNSRHVLILKKFDCRTKTMSGLTSILVDMERFTMGDVLENLYGAKMNELPEVEIWEEEAVHSNSINHITEYMVSLKTLGLISGDILVLQEEYFEPGQNAIDWLRLVYNRIDVAFLPFISPLLKYTREFLNLPPLEVESIEEMVENDSDQILIVPMFRNWTLSQCAEALSSSIGAEPENIIFHVGSSRLEPRFRAFGDPSVELQSALQSTRCCTKSQHPLLFWEHIDYPSSMSRHSFFMVFGNQILRFSLDPAAKLTDLFNSFCETVGVQVPLHLLRLVSIQDHYVEKVFDSSLTNFTIANLWTHVSCVITNMPGKKICLRLDAVDPEEYSVQNATESSEMVVWVVYFYRNTYVYLYGSPFTVVVPKKGEFSSWKQRIATKAQVSEEEMNSWSFAIVQPSGSSYFRATAISDGTRMDTFDWNKPQLKIGIDQGISSQFSPRTAALTEKDRSLKILS